MIIIILWNKAVACTVTMCQTADGTAILNSASFIQLQDKCRNKISVVIFKPFL